MDQILTDIARHGPLAGMLPGDFLHAWVLGGDAAAWWPEMDGVYMHCTETVLYLRAGRPSSHVGLWSPDGSLRRCRRASIYGL